jgi:hypothetical protein
MFAGKLRKIERLDFILAGAQKAGTTAMHYFLTRHPDIKMGDQQEIHFFDDERVFSQQPVDYELLHRHFPPLARSTIAGDCTPNYLYWPPAAERIWNYNPHIKLLVLLRNPIDRAFAHWNMQRSKGREPLDFLEAVKQEKNRAGDPLSLETRRFAYVARGFYAQQLERFFRFFPRVQLKGIKSEEFRVKQRETLDSVFGFLGVRSLARVRNRDRNVVPYERAITLEERKYLYDIFVEDIIKLEQMLGWDCSDWKIL